MGGDGTQRLHVFIEGLVQGVGFRHATYMKASELGLTGWVRNCVDGRVEAVFEGDNAALDEMLEWCNDGPHLSNVRNVDARLERASMEFSSFEIVF